MKNIFKFFLVIVIIQLNSIKAQEAFNQRFGFKRNVNDNNIRFKQLRSIQEDTSLVFTNKGKMNNIVVFVRFADEIEFSDQMELYNKVFNNSSEDAKSVYNYFKEASYKKFLTKAYFLPQQTANTVISFQDIHPRSFYKKRSIDNPNGYVDNIDSCWERQDGLVKTVTEYIENQLPDSVNIDYNNDGYFDLLTIMFSGKHDEPFTWTTILWESCGFYTQYSVHEFSIKSKKMGMFAMLFEATTKEYGYNWASHEIFHGLGAPDLKHYNWDNLSPIGRWDNMSIEQNGQQLCAYSRFRYGKWIDSIQEIKANGTYSLNDLNLSEHNCFKIKSAYSETEYFILEYRRKEGNFDTQLPGSGLLVFRINTLADGLGNGDYPKVPDEVYIFRPGGSITSPGSVNNANLNASRNCINDTSYVRCYLSNGKPGGLNISNIREDGDSVLFYVNMEPVKINAIDNFVEYNLQIQPNPTEKYIYIKTPLFFNSNLIQLFDPTGHLTLSRTLPAMQQGEEISIDLSGQANGVYLVKLSSGGKVYYGKVILVKN